MQTLNVLQLQLAESLKGVDQVSFEKVAFDQDKLDIFKSKMKEFLGTSNSIQISNRNSAKNKDDGFLILIISTEGIRILHSSSIKKSEYKFYFKDNSLLLNQREVDISFLDSFIRKILFVASRIELDDYEVIKT